jgi:hypothetical protein
MFKNRTAKRSWAILMAGLVLVTVSALFLVQRVAAVSCFTDTTAHWAEGFICWLNSKGITSGYPDGTFRPDNTISRAEVAVFMQKIITTGDAQITIGPGNWVPNGSTPTEYVTYWTNVEYLQNTSTGSGLYQLSPSLPTAILGQEMFLKGVKLCYNATHGASITAVYLRQYSGGATPTIYSEVADTTVRTDATCRTYYLTTPTSLWGSDHVVLLLIANFSTVSDYVEIATTTFVISPSTYSGVLEIDGARPSLGLPIDAGLEGDAP